MFCENCGANLPKNSRFCASCGAKIEVQPAGRAAEQTVNPIPLPPPAFAPAAQTSPPPPTYTAATQTLPPQSHGPQPASVTGVQAQPGSEPLSVGQYIKMFLLMGIPILNIILLFVWSFGSAANLNRKNFARASLILAAIMLILYIIAGGAIMRALYDITGGYY